VNGLSTTDLKAFQEQVSELLLRHRSVLDVLSKYDQSNSSVHRSVIKAVTECGCVEVKASKQPIEENMSLQQAKDLLETHLYGKPCEGCAEAIAAELGRNIFYMSALCNLLDIDLQQVIDKESSRCATLGLFNLS